MAKFQPEKETWWKNMDSACFTYEGLPVSLYHSPCNYTPPVWILGKQYGENSHGEIIITIPSSSCSYDHDVFVVLGFFM